ncbi:MAG: hypothetical protein AAF571_11350, partial [Verrucomicrobiota bacterium]
MKSNCLRCRVAHRGFAIVSVLLVIVVLTIMVVAFLQSMRIDRLTARAYLNKAKAEMIAQSATEIAINDLLESMTDSTGNQTRLYTTGLYQPPAASSSSLGPITTITRNEEIATDVWQEYSIPLVSKSQEPDDFVTNFTQTMDDLLNDLDDSSKFVDLNRKEQIKVKASDGSDDDDYRAVLQEVRDSNNNVIGRYAYIVVDEQAKLNPSIHTGQARVNYGESAGEIPISLGNDNLLNSIEQTTFQSLFNVLETIKSPFTIGQVFSSTERADERKHLFGYYSAPNEDVIPSPYPEAGKAKYNLNALAEDTTLSATERAEAIADIIDLNLPNFKDRDPSFQAGGVSSQAKRYLNRLTASIVDYIDSDVDITTVNGGEPAGRDLFPLVTTVSVRYKWNSQTSSGNEYFAEIESQAFAELWNPYTTEVSGDVNFNIRNRTFVRYGTGGVFPFDDYESNSVTVSLKPNEFKTVEFDTVTQVFSFISFDGSPPSPPEWFQTPSSTPSNTNVPFELEWNGNIVDMHRRSPVGPGSAHAGMSRRARTLSLNQQHYQTAFIPSFADHKNLSSGQRTVGDPRFTYLSNYDWGHVISGDSSYGQNTRWNGRYNRTTVASTDYVSIWRNRDFIRRNPVAGQRPGNL